MLAEAASVAAINWLWVSLQALVILALAAVSALFSGSEAALFSQTAVQLQHDATHPNPLRRMAAALMEDGKNTLMILLLGNTAVNTLLFAMAYVLFHSLGRYYGAWLGPVGGTLTILIVIGICETIPKVLGVALCDRLAPYAAVFLRTIGVVLGPIGRILDLIVIEPLSRILFGRPSGAEDDRELGITTDELKALLEMSRRGGVINSEEDAFLREVIDLRAIRARDVMVPRI